MMRISAEAVSVPQADVTEQFTMPSFVLSQFQIKVSFIQSQLPPPKASFKS
ncbi:hypothetical protein BaRGS_00011134, partial [Batillaria attramentaria]